MRTLPLRRVLSMLLIGVVLAHPVVSAAQAFACSLLEATPSMNRPVPRPPHRVRYATAACPRVRRSKA
ncbi:MAG TPA: hypothetical protein VGZ22_15490, partial [Isosphaeraceae bacterium]|nr:hypothetical protein [Isosphaeraceae bacterium]